MDLETDRVRWAAIILFICAFIVVMLGSRHYEQSGQTGQTDADSKMQQVQEEKVQIRTMDIGVTVRVGMQQHRILLYQDGEYMYVFVPAAADTTTMRWSYDENLYKIDIMENGYSVKSGDQISVSVEDQEGEKIRITDFHENRNSEYQLRLMQSENIPSIFVNTQSGAMDWIHADKRNRESGEFFFIDEKGLMSYAGAMEKIKCRGNSSWIEDKKSYSVTLVEEARLAGMPAASKWVLQANALDATRMRNKLVYDMAHELGVPYAIDTAYVDVWLNGEYAGNYLLCEKVEPGEERVNISTADIPQEENGRYTRDNNGAWWEYESEHEQRSGYLLEFNERIEGEEVGYFCAAGQKVEVKSPTGLTYDEYEYINEYVQNMVESLRNAAWSDEYLEYIDLDSWGTLFLINELTNDTDANRYSVFYHKDKGTKMYAGPIWDYDIAWGNDFLGKDVRCSFFRNGWYGTLYDNKIFYGSIVEKYRERMKPVLEKYLEEYINTVSEQIRESVRMDDIRWAHSEGYTRRSSERVWQQAVYNLKDYMRERMQFFDDVWLSGETYHRVFFWDGDMVVAVTYVRDGDVIPDTLLKYVAECLAQNSWRSPEGKTYDILQPVFSDMDLCAQTVQTDIESP